ncbi:MAG TPA: glycosyltransferase family 2 protein [Stellaceae bacterium]|nr:glycosyltransferase family 2 protein [Stellaceae bacterium]
MSEISVVVPYYQREAGHLPRAIRSALRQRGVETPAVIVVDDGSPLPAEDELAALDASERRHVTLLRQSNRGPGPARNAALDAVPTGSEWTAFLDSDDVWEEYHLARGLSALRQGFDFCFANLLRDGDRDTHFGLVGFDPSAHRPLAPGPSLFAYRGDFFAANLHYSPVGTSTVIIRNSVLGSLRFPPTADTPGEDLIFWLAAARATTRVAFDGTIQVRYGRGNITNSDSWKSAKALRTTVAYGTYAANIRARFPLNAAEAAVVDRMQRENRRAVARVVLAMLREGRLPDPAVFGPYLRRQPAAIADMMRVLGEEGLRRALRACRIGRRDPAGAGNGD